MVSPVGRPCLTMQRLGKSLKDLMISPLNPTGRYPVDHVKKLALEVIKLLVFLQTNQVLHSDLKPENFCFLRDFEADEVDAHGMPHVNLISIRGD